MDFCNIIVITNYIQSNNNFLFFINIHTNTHGKNNTFLVEICLYLIQKTIFFNRFVITALRYNAS